MADKFKIDTLDNVNEEKLSMLAELFKTYGDVTRLNILFRLSDSCCCVTDLADSLYDSICHITSVKGIKASAPGMF